MKNLKSYSYSYKILFDYFQRIPGNFIAQFFIHRYIEVTSILVAAILSSIPALDAKASICVVALIQLFSSLLINESYAKIVPYLRIIYLDKSIVAYYLLINATVPFFFYLMMAIVLSLENEIVLNICLMSILLFNNNLFANLLHIFSFSMKETFVFFPLVIGAYLIVFMQLGFLLLSALTLLAMLLFIVKIRSY